MGKNDDLKAFEGMDADDLKYLLLAERRDVARLKQEIRNQEEHFLTLAKIFLAGRFFTVDLADDLKVQIIAIRAVDKSLPCPLEPRDWRAETASDDEIRTAVSSIHFSPLLGKFEEKIDFKEGLGS